MSNLKKYQNYCLYGDLSSETYTPCCKPSPNLNHLCEQHADKQISQFDLMGAEKKYLVNLIKELLIKVETAISKKSKANNAIKIMDTLVQHQYFLHYNSKFKETVCNKLIEFESESGYIDANKYQRIFFPEIYGAPSDDELEEELEELEVEDDGGVIEITI